MIHADFERLLKHAMGLHSASIGSSAIEQAVNARLSVCELNDGDAYLERVRTSATELQALIEAVIVPETWFFRDPVAFAELTRVANEWLPGNPLGTFRLLSVPCSSGEEPYSMTMALRDAGFPDNRYRIDAVDISTQGLKVARGTLYRKNSFRGADLTFRDRYFEPTALGYRLSDAVLNGVHFAQGNVLADDFLPGAAIYDVIFCRNLLIYFDRPTQDRAVEVLKRLLKPTGILFVGPSEGSLLLSHNFDSNKMPMAFAFRRSVSGPLANPPDCARANPAPPPNTPPLSRVPTPDTAARPQRAAQASALLSPTHDEAFRLADQGRMAEAAEACELHLLKHGPSVQSFFLLGLIRAAAGRLTEARQYYRKALYLDRHHHDTLVHLSMLLEKQGDAAGSQVIRDRLQRLRQQRTGR